MSKQLKSLGVREVPLDQIDFSLNDYREIPEQHADALSAMIKARAQGKPFKSPGEYLGDVEVTDSLFQQVTNINPFVNSLAKVRRGTYLMIADFDYEGDGHFIGLRLEPRKQLKK